MIDTQSNAQETRTTMVDKLGTKKNFISKVVNANLQKGVIRFQAVNPYMNRTLTARNNSSRIVGGALSLRNVGGSLALPLYCPLHLIDITSQNNVQNTGSVTTNPLWELYFTTIGSISQGAFFQNIVGDTFASRGVATAWQDENLATGAALATVTLPNRRTYLDSVDLKMYCYGAAWYPVTYTISIVQLKEDWLHPSLIGQGSIENVTSQRLNFWMEIIKPNIAHPIASETFMNQRPLKVLKSHSFTIEPVTAGSELLPDIDAAGQSDMPRAKLVEMKIPINKMMQYDWCEQLTDNSAADPVGFAVNKGQTITLVRPRDRIYIMVTASNRTNNTVNAVNATYEPSYDLVVKKNYTNIT